MAERMEERAQDRARQARAGDTVVDAERRHRAESLRLARVDLDRQRVAAPQAARKQQLEDALSELDRQLATLTTGSR